MGWQVAEFKERVRRRRGDDCDLRKRLTICYVIRIRRLVPEDNKIMIVYCVCLCINL